MKLVVFDMDTALCPTNTMDGLAFERALQDVSGDVNFRLEQIPEQLHFRNALYLATKRMPNSMDVAELRNRFNFHLRRHFLIRPSVIQANYSLIETVNVIQHRKDTIVALVSTSSAMAVQLKARAIGLMSEMLPVATHEDADGLPELLMTLKGRVKRSFGVQFDQAQLVGSRAWYSASQSNDFELVEPMAFLAEDRCYMSASESARTPYIA